MNIQLDHINLSVIDLKKSIQFYQALFDFEIVEQGDPNLETWAILQRGESMLCLTTKNIRKSTDEDYATIHLANHFALRTSDENEWSKRFRYYQPETYYPTPHKYPHSTSWYIKDPNGHRIEVVAWKKDQVQFDPNPYQNRSGGRLDKPMIEFPIIL